MLVAPLVSDIEERSSKALNQKANSFRCGLPNMQLVRIASSKPMLSRNFQAASHDHLGQSALLEQWWPVISERNPVNNWISKVKCFQQNFFIKPVKSKWLFIGPRSRMLCRAEGRTRPRIHQSKSRFVSSKCGLRLRSIGVHTERPSTATFFGTTPEHRKSQRNQRRTQWCAEMR